MATDAENLATTRSNLLAALATDSASPSKSYSIDGQSVDRNGWRRSLVAELKSLNEMATALGGPFEVETIGEP